MGATTEEVVVRSEQRCYGGTIGFYAHASQEVGGEMRFGVFVPPHVAGARLPVLYYLAGLTCTEETFLIKAGALRLAAELGLILVAPDTSPRATRYEGDAQSWDFGQGAGFYLDATEEPWAGCYRMESYCVHELPALIERRFPASAERGIFGHSMGGHGALVLALRHRGHYRSVSAFAPICNPTAVPWGEKAFSGYLGADRARWLEHDASELLARERLVCDLLVDQGLADKFLDTQLRPQALEEAAARSGQALTLRRHEGYDHSYWFIQTFVDDHLRWHAARLRPE